MTRSPRELANQKIQHRKQQEALLSDLLTVVDALDRAAEHWQQAETSQFSPAKPLSWWQRWRALLTTTMTTATAADSEPMAEVVTSAKEGIEMIRATMLNILSQHEVEPLLAKGQPFDPESMNALGQQADAIAPPNTVVQEVVRGYQWKDRILREAQVIVAASSTAASSTTASSTTASSVLRI